MEDLFIKLTNSHLFKDKTAKELEEVMGKINYRIVKKDKNELIFDSFSSTNFIGLILSGQIFVEKILPCGKSVMMFGKKSGDIFGEVAAFSDAAYYPCNVIAKEKSSVLIFYKEDFFELLKLDSVILKNFLNLICNKAYSLNSKVESLSFSSPKQRIAYSLLNDFNILSDSTIKLPFSKKVWADKLNISRASLYRELNSLCDESILSLPSTNIIEITNIQKLEKLLLN